MEADKKNRIAKARLWYVVMAALLFIVEICIGVFLKGGLIRAYGGDVLVLPLLYCMIRILYAKKDRFSTRLLPFLLFLLGVLMEVLQAIHLADRLGITNRLLRVIIGSTGDPLDILCYGLGTALIYGLICLHQAVEKKGKV